MISILLADDHTVVREGIKRLLGGFEDLQVVAEAADGTEVMAGVRRDGFDILVTDLSMPGREGVDLIKQVRREAPRLPIVVLTMHPPEQYAVRVIRAGAGAYLTKDVAPDELAEAIRRVARGGMYLTPRVAELLAVEIRPRVSGAPHHTLSDREFQVFQMLVEGRTVGEIAERLCVSIKTISTHKTRILEKMGATSVADLVRYAVKYRLHPDETT
jgi:DNA-binding NarL/FixJ family response regulator